MSDLHKDQLRYYKSSKKWWKYDPKHSVLPFINKYEKVLDVGCSYGDFGAALIQKGCEVDGVEVYGPAIEQAQKILNHVYILDLNNINLADNTIKSCYDVITFMDVLEHFVEPALVIQYFKKFLNVNGRIYVSLPNVANIQTRFSLLCGNWNYEDYGVMDRTHLRFFTRKTALELVMTRFKNAKIIAKTPILDILVPRRALTWASPLFIKLMPSLFTLQFVIEGKD